MKLYDFPSAPNPRRVRVFLAEKRVSIPTVTIDLAAQEQLTPAFRAINPRATVPALELDDGTVLTEAPVICRYLEDLHPDRPLLGGTPEERARIAMWERRMEIEGLLAAAEALRNGSRRFADRALVGPRNYPQIPALVERGMARLASFFQDLNDRLAHAPFVAGDTFTFADITGFIAVDFANWVKATPPEDLTHLARWRRDLAARPCFSPIS